MKLPLCVALLIPIGLFAAEKNRFNLPDKPVKPRFKVTGRIWPREIGDADLCLWHDDKVAALSLGVDDNNAGDIPWWKEQAALYDFKVTWFVITGRVDCNRATGYWKDFRELSALGHGVESHTVTHYHIQDAGWGSNQWIGYAKSKARDAVQTEPTDIPAGTAWEYAESKAQIEKNIPGKMVGAVAYPGGSNSVKCTDPHLAAKYYRMARAANGENTANAINYMAVGAQSNWHFGDPALHGGGNLNNVLDPNLYRGMYYRGWLVLFTHQIIREGPYANLPRLQQTFDFIKANRNDLWVGLFAEVGRYGQERDTATLKVESPGPDKITFLLTDEMDDSYFNFPLTVKVRIPDDWKEVTARQADKPVEAKIIQHEGAAYALVQTVPDAGLVTLTAGHPK